MIPEMTAVELREILRKLSIYADLRPNERDARSLAIRCGQIAALVETASADCRGRITEPGLERFDDSVLRIVSGASLTRRELRLAGIFALDGFWFISTLNHWFGL
jgi:hypothetical protein